MTYVDSSRFSLLFIQDRLGAVEILTISDLSEIIKQALLHVLTPSDIAGGCMVTEITLFNHNIITGNNFSAALVTGQFKRINRKLQTL
jgi:hypothetical protein